MLTKPDISDDRLAACLQSRYGLPITGISFLPLGADPDSAVYCASAGDGTVYFVKLRRDRFDETSVAIPHLLSERGIATALPPFPTTSGALWTVLGAFTVTLSPFVSGHDAHDRLLTPGQWAKLGSALRAIHGVSLPASLEAHIPIEDYSPLWRLRARDIMAQVEEGPFCDEVAARFADVARVHRQVIACLIDRASDLAAALCAQPLPHVLCHGDLHAWNVLIADDGALHLVDWDTVLLAPRERDLMAIGAGIGGIWKQPAEMAAFYAGYGPVHISAAALAYYCCERIVADIAVYGRDILATDQDRADREAGLAAFAAQFKPGNVAEIALATPWAQQPGGE